MNFLKRLSPIPNFKAGILPLLMSLSDYLEAWVGDMQANKEISLDVNRDSIVANLINKHVYPEWVFDVGFNPGLRAGFRFFLIKLDQVVETIFSINYLIHRKIAAELMQHLRGNLIETIARNNELVLALVNFFKNGTYIDTNENFTTDMTALEENMQKRIPNDLEALGISPDYIAVTSLVRDIKDMRELLLQLILSLPASG
ncbi:MAG: hypothetical protein WAW86_06170 [Gammaproteobacteria bacterium]